MATASYVQTPLPKAARCAKFIVDELVGITCLFLISPLVLFNWLYYLPKGGGSPIVSEQRVGLHGKTFAFYKLRIRTRDHKTTSVGEWFRAKGVDECPQVINIIFRTMSLVGPRPLLLAVHNALVASDKCCKELHISCNRTSPCWMQRYSALPGLLGLAIGTITHRLCREMGWDDEHERWLEYDLRYIRAWNLVTEIHSIWVSVVDIFFGHDPQPTAQ